MRKEKAQVKNYITLNFRIYSNFFVKFLLTFACAYPLPLWLTIPSAGLGQLRSAPVYKRHVRGTGPALGQTCRLLGRSTRPGTTSHQRSRMAFRPELPSVRPVRSTGQKELGFVSNSLPALWDSAQAIGKAIMHICYSE